MEIKLAETAGFCMGVRRAVDMVLAIAHAKAWKAFYLWPLIHNPQTVELLKHSAVFCPSTRRRD
jgi:4-hydroxy-3-methylbut-2-enyl diphosphate reductase